MNLTKQARVATLQEANKRKSVAAVRRAEAAARELCEAGSAVNVHAVAAHAGVARSFIYTRPDLLEVIRELGASTARLRVQRTTTRASDASLRTRLADALDRQRELAAELVTVKVERERLLQEVRELRRQLRTYGRK